MADVWNLDEILRLTRHPVTVLVNNVGAQSKVTPLLDFDPAEFRTVLDTNVVGPLHLSRLVVGRMVLHGIPGAVKAGVDR